MTTQRTSSEYRVRVDRSLTAEAAFARISKDFSIREKDYGIRRDIFEAMPRGTGSFVRLVLFKPERYRHPDELAQEFAIRGLVPADPYVVAAFNAEHPDFVRTRPHATVWIDHQGRDCVAEFCGHRGFWVGLAGRRVWPNGWWFAGIQKK